MQLSSLIPLNISFRVPEKKESPTGLAHLRTDLDPRDAFENELFEKVMWEGQEISAHLELVST